MQRLNQKGSSHLILPVVVMLLIAAVGVKVLTASHADSKTVTTVTNAANTSTTIKNEALFGPANAVGGSNATSSVPYSFVGSQTVTNVAAGQSLSYNGGVKGTTVTSCYTFYVTQPKAGTETFPVEFTTNNNYVTVNVSSTTTDNLQQVCVPPGKLTNPGFSVENLAPATAFPGNIEVLSDTLTW